MPLPITVTRNASPMESRVRLTAHARFGEEDGEDRNGQPLHGVPILTLHGLHWVRDVTFGEDGSPIYRGQAPELFAVLRNSAIALLDVLAQPSVPAALREVTTSLAAFHKPFDRLAALLNPPTMPVPPRPP